MPKKLLYGLTASPSLGFLHGQVEFMKKHGYEVHVVVSPGPGIERWGTAKTAIMHLLPMAREINIWSDLCSLARWINVLARVRPDIVNISTPKAALLGSISAALMRVPRRVYVVRGLRFEGEEGRRRRLLLWFERLICALSTEVVVVSASVGDAMRRARVTRKPLILIGAGSSNGVNQSAWLERVQNVDRDAIKHTLGIEPENTVLLFVGRLTEDKGTGTIIDLLRMLDGASPVSFVLVGPIESKRAGSALETSDFDVSIVGAQKDVAPYYAIADVLIHPTKREGFPNVVLEAGAVGIPVVTTTATGAIDSVVDGVTGFTVPVADGVSMATAVGRLVDDPQVRREMGEAAKSRVAFEFRPERIWLGMESVYSGRACTWVTHF